MPVKFTLEETIKDKDYQRIQYNFNVNNVEYGLIIIEEKSSYKDPSIKSTNEYNILVREEYDQYILINIVAKEIQKDIYQVQVYKEIYEIQDTVELTKKELNLYLKETIASMFNSYMTL